MWTFQIINYYYSKFFSDQIDSVIIRTKAVLYSKSLFKSILNTRAL